MVFLMKFYAIYFTAMNNLFMVRFNKEMYYSLYSMNVDETTVYSQLKLFIISLLLRPSYTVPFWSVTYRKCTGKFQPFSFRQSCIISQDCVLGPWQGLTTINQTCVSRNNVVKSGYLYQKRDVIQIPLGDGKPCGPLEEYIPIKSSQKINCPRWWSQILWN